MLYSIVEQLNGQSRIGCLKISLGISKISVASYKIVAVLRCETLTALEMHYNIAEHSTTQYRVEPQIISFLLICIVSVASNRIIVPHGERWIKRHDTFNASSKLFAL